jgi:hypothetical protein
MTAIAIYGVYRLVDFLIWLRKLENALKSVPAMGNPHWLFGNIPQIRKGGGFVESRAAVFGELGVDTLKAYLGPVPIIVTRDIEFFKYIHSNQTSSPTPFIRVDTPMLNPVVCFFVKTKWFYSGFRWAQTGLQ